MTRRRRVEHAPRLAAQRADRIAFLHQRGLELAPSLGVSPPIVTEAIDQVVGLLGEEWLKAEFARPSPAMRGAHTGHRIVEAFRTGDENAVVAVLELALYAKHLSSCEGFDAVVPAIRDKYKSTLLQLAFAYRIKLHGPRITLEPKSAGGRSGDIAFRWSGRNYVVECYRRQEQRDPLQDLVEFSVKRIMGEEACYRQRLRVRLRLKRVPSDAERLELEREACRLVTAVGAGPTMETEVAAGTIGVDVLGPDAEPDLDPNGEPLESAPHAGWQVLIVVGRFPESALMSPMNPLDGRFRGSRMMIWPPKKAPVRMDERVSLLVDRIEQKLVQARPDQGTARRIIVAQVLDGDARVTRDDRLLRHLHGRFWHGHAGIGAVILCARVTHPRFRPAYIGSVVPGRTHDPFVDVWPRWALDTDYNRDLFEDWDRAM